MTPLKFGEFFLFFRRLGYFIILYIVYCIIYFIIFYIIYIFSKFAGLRWGLRAAFCRSRATGFCPVGSASDGPARFFFKIFWHSVADIKKEEMRHN